MRMKVTVKFECDIGDQTMEEVVEYLKSSNYYEVLEWIPDDNKKSKISWDFKEVKK